MSWQEKAVIGTDRLLYKLTGGKFTLVSLSRQTGLTLITVGAKSGERRENQVQYVADGDSMLVVGSNWGKPHHPAWTTNLLKNPDIQVNVRGDVRDVRGTMLEGAEREAAWTRMVAAWPAFQDYVERSGGRELRVFRLTAR
ncbi:nitroreductase family deazaflavin-dependent oxidoreductase [Lentzea flaviverrucosa]|uniref:Deazaflavin-dependent oxidoreductase, nitroreductase family n=1 Tax=Lentzea flaviverrucosa TaxID=200379 RepID=A0A1H9K809_9PSEU|nr:nitroreductase family deazaflavin-dependent oxidoreductase [Lentzea flaviverrucosa]RDI17778.1 deazaflavin-dependent oxidoreductase (nitroreductase family) [Lentzea flaviverrucosa]SEQ95053.1 deazaflavin-dependent oxidoreductase, nitroreductase family [Lentzea flaviverrucosa]